MMYQGSEDTIHGCRRSTRCSGEVIQGSQRAIQGSGDVILALAGVVGAPGGRSGAPGLGFEQFAVHGGQQENQLQALLPLPRASRSVRTGQTERIRCKGSRPEGAQPADTSA